MADFFDFTDCTEARRLERGETRFAWYVWYPFLDSRNEALWAIRERLNLPWLVITDLSDLPKLAVRADLVFKARPWRRCTPLAFLRQLESECAHWMG